MTYRERRLARAERLRGWADSRDAKASTASETAHRMADVIPFGQPILVGHYSERSDRRYRTRIADNMDRAVEHARKAESMRSRAANIKAQAEHAIYSDDPDAIERLEQKVADLEAQRDRIKRYNASCRKGTPDLSILDDRQRDDLATIARVASYQVGDKGQFPSYALSNLGGVISSTRKRLDGLRNPAPPRGRLITARYDGTCTECDGPIARGEQILYTRGEGARHADCPKEQQT
jgi:hypothetical protein